MVLWHFVMDKRPAAVDSPLDVGFWAITEDMRLIAFDRWKRWKKGFAACLAPAAMMQLLQFWLPRSEELERALVGSIRLPFLLMDFDKSAERVTTRILRSLSRYEGVDELSVETVSDILMSEALRTRLALKADEADDEVLLREAFVERTAELEKQLVAAKTDVSAARGSAARDQEALTRERKQREEIEAELVGLREAAKRQSAAVGDQLAKARDEAEREATLRRQLEADVGNISREMDVQAAKRRFVWKAIVMLMPAAAAAYIVVIAGAIWDAPVWLTYGVAATLAVAIWLEATSRVGRREELLVDWSVTRGLSWSGNRLLKMLGVLALGVASSLIAVALQASA